MGTVAENRLIEQLPEPARASLLSLCTPVPLRCAAVLHEPGVPMGHVHFPIDGVVSMLVQLQGRDRLEVGMVGCEGMVGGPLVLGQAHSPLRALVLGEGASRCIGAEAFRLELTRSPPLRLLMNRYVAFLMAQVAARAACQRFHPIGPRLGRWLLMCQDRARADRFRVTHQTLAAMLGVRRVGITFAAGALQRAGVIRYHRGEVTVLDRTGLRAHACSCYAADLVAYERCLGPCDGRVCGESPPSKEDRSPGAARS